MSNPNIYPQFAAAPVSIRLVRLSSPQVEDRYRQALPAHAIHYHFLGAVDPIPLEQVQRHPDPTQRNNMAFIATVPDGERDREIGLCSVTRSNRLKTRALDLTISADYQSSGLDQQLLNSFIDHARGYGITTLYCVDNRDDQDTAALAASVGMQSWRNPADTQQTVYSLTL